jgi:hypothetical protein
MSSEEQPAASGANETEYAIVINGELAVVPHKEVSYEEAVSIAYPVPPDPNTTFTVSYAHAVGPRHEGLLVRGQVIEVKTTGTEFDVSPTGKS